MATYLGSTSIGGSVVGLSSAFDAVGQSLTNLKGVASVQLGLIADAQAAIKAQADATLVAKSAIRIPAVADLQASLDASLAIGTQLSGDLSNPAGYLEVLLDGLSTVEASLQLALPTVQLDLQIDANAATSASLTAKIASVDLQLEALVTINAALLVQIQALVAIQAALSAAISAAASALSLYVSMAATLSTSGAYVIRSDTALSGIGADIDSVTSSTGLPGSTTVRAIVVLVDASAPAFGALNATFKVS